MKQAEPKEYLKQFCKYKESDSIKLFELLDIQEVSTNCPYFAVFLKKWDKAILHHSNHK